MRRRDMSLTDEEDTNEVDPQITALRDNARNNNRTAIASRIRYLRTSGSSDPSDPPSSNDTERQAEIQALIEAAGIGKFSTADGAITDPQVLTRICSSVSGLEEAALSKSRTESEDAEPPQDRTLVDACTRGDVGAVQQLLSSGWNANETTDEGESLLSLACSSGQYELVEVLLQHNAQVEECGAKGECTPLMEAASGGYANVVQLLINHGADVNSTSSTGNTALTYASCGGFEDVVKILIENGAALESHNENGHTPLMEAASGGHVPVAELLLQKGAGINTSSHEFKESALTLACYKGHLAMVRYLLTRGADQEHKTDEMHTALMEASMDGHVDVARLLLDSGAQVNMPTDSFESPLTLAACGGHVELAQLLIDRGALLEEVNDEGYTAIMEAAREGHEEMVTLLLSKGCNVNAKTEETQETALTLACCGGFLEVVELLVDGGADIELGSSTPLMEAAQEGQIEVVKFLIDKQADVKATTKSDDTALHFACEQGHTDIAELLLQNGAELEYKTECGRTPLMKAARAGHLCAVQFLIAQGANVNNVTNNNDHSVLSLACAFGHTNVVETLLCQGADPSYKLKDDSNMLLEASRNGHVNVVKLLLDFPRNYVAVSPENQAQSDDLPLRPLSDVTTDQHDTGADGAAYTASYDGVASNGSGEPPITPFEEPSNIGSGGGNESFDENMSEQAAAVVTRLIQHGSWLTQAAEGYLPQAAKEEVEKDVTYQIERFLRTMASDPSVGLALVEGNCKELEARVMKAVEKQFYLLYGDKSSQIMRQILEDKNKTYDDRGNPDGSDPFASMEGLPNDFSLPDPKFSEHPAELLPQQIRKNQVVREERFGGKLANAAPHGLHMINNGSSGCISQVAKEDAESFCQCQRHQCPITPEVHDERDGDDQTSSNDAPSGGLLSAYLKPDVDACTESNHDTPLTLACAGGHEELVQLLLANGASIEHRDKKGFTPLILAATAGHVNVVRILSLQKANLEAQSDRTKDTPLSLACSGGRMEVVQMLLQHGANKEHRNVSDYTPLSLAASGGYVQIIKMLLSNGAEINSRTGSKLGISPLMLAAMNGHTQAVQLLLDMGADINAQIETNRNTALTLACFQGRHEVVSLLVDRKANVEHRAKTGLTPLMEAASGGYAEVGKVLLDKGADPNAAPVPSSRDTALTIAADKGHFRFCELILERGAQVEVRNKKGNTSLWLACNGGHHEVVKLLVKQGADVNAADNRNVTPLMASFRKGHVPVVQYLANVVSQFPSENECERFIMGLNSEKDADLKNRLKQCKECIEQSKARQAEEANKYAANLLQEIDRENVNEEKRKARQAKKREKKKLRKRMKAKKEEEDATTTKKEETGTTDVDGSNEMADDSDRTEGCSRVPQSSDIRSTPNDRSSSTLSSLYEFLQPIPQPSSPPPSTAHQLPKSAAISSSSSSSSSNATQGAKQQPAATTTATASSSDLTVPTVNKTPTHNNRSTHKSSSSSNVSTTTTTQQHNKQTASVVSKSSDDNSTTPTRSSPLSSKGVSIKSSSADSSTSSNAMKYDSPVASPRSSQHRGENSGRKSKSSKPSSSSSSSSASTLTGSAVKQYNRSELSQNSKSAQSRLSGAVSSSGISPSSTSSTSKVSSPAKRGVRREEAGGWKEVSSRKCTSNTLKLYVHSRLISRLIGRGGCNINAIREATGAHIDIDKQRKGSQERTVTIKGTHEAQTHAYNLITTIIREDGSDQDVQSIINRMQQVAISGANQTSGNHGRNPPTKPHLQVIEAPIPARSAWNVPPPIAVSKSNAPWANTAGGGGSSSAAASSATPNGTQQSSSIRTPSASSVVYTNSILKGQSDSSFLVSPSAATIQSVIRDDKLLSASVTNSGKKDVRKNLFPTQTFELNESGGNKNVTSATSSCEVAPPLASVASTNKSPAAPITTTTTSPFIFSPNKTKSGADKPVQPVAPMMAATKVPPRSNPIVPPPPANNNPSPPSQQTVDNMDMMTSSSKDTMSPPQNKVASNDRGGIYDYDSTTTAFAALDLSKPPSSSVPVPSSSTAVIANVTSSSSAASVNNVDDNEIERCVSGSKIAISFDKIPELKASSVVDTEVVVPTEPSVVAPPPASIAVTASAAYVASSQQQQSDVDGLLNETSHHREHDLQQVDNTSSSIASMISSSKRTPVVQNDMPQLISSSSNGLPFMSAYGITPDVSQFNSAATFPSSFGPARGGYSTTIWQQNQKPADKITPQNVESVASEADDSKPMIPIPTAIGSERRQNCKVSNSSVVSSAAAVVEHNIHQQNTNSSLHQSANNMNQFWNSSDMRKLQTASHINSNHHTMLSYNPSNSNVNRGWTDELSQNNQSMVGGVSHPPSQQMIMSESLRQHSLAPDQRGYNKTSIQQTEVGGHGSSSFGPIGSGSRYMNATTNNPLSMKQQQQQSHNILPIGTRYNNYRHNTSTAPNFNPQLQAQQQLQAQHRGADMNALGSIPKSAASGLQLSQYQQLQQQQQQQHSSATAHMNQPIQPRFNMQHSFYEDTRNDQQQQRYQQSTPHQMQLAANNDMGLWHVGGGRNSVLPTRHNPIQQKQDMQGIYQNMHGNAFGNHSSNIANTQLGGYQQQQHDFNTNQQQDNSMFNHQSNNSFSSRDSGVAGGNHLDNNEMFRNASTGGGGGGMYSSGGNGLWRNNMRHPYQQQPTAAAAAVGGAESLPLSAHNRHDNQERNWKLPNHMWQ